MSEVHAKKIEDILINYLKKRLVGRQLELSLLILQGLSNEQIGKRMGIQRESAKQNCYVMFKQFRVRSKFQFTAHIYRKAFELYFSKKKLDQHISIGLSSILNDDGA